MEDMTFRKFDVNLGMMLRDVPRGTTADLTDLVIAYWGGKGVIYAYLRDDGRGLVEEEFDPEDLLWEEWRDPFRMWLAAPRFSYRQEVAGWLSEAPPLDLQP